MFSTLTKYPLEQVSDLSSDIRTSSGTMGEGGRGQTYNSKLISLTFHPKSSNLKGSLEIDPARKDW